MWVDGWRRLAGWPAARSAKITLLALHARPLARSLDILHTQPNFCTPLHSKMALCSAAQCRPLPQRASLRVPSSSSGFLGAGSIPRAPLRAVSRPAARQVKVSGLFGLGVPELAVIAGVAALIFGKKALRECWLGKLLPALPPVAPLLPPAAPLPLCKATLTHLLHFGCRSQQVA